MSNALSPRFPVWIYHGEDGDLYGMPIHGNSGVKIGVDVGGDHVTAETRNYVPNQRRLNQCINFSREHIPRVFSFEIITLMTSISKKQYGEFEEGFFFF